MEERSSIMNTVYICGHPCRTISLEKVDRYISTGRFVLCHKVNVGPTAGEEQRPPASMLSFGKVTPELSKSGHRCVTTRHPLDLGQLSRDVTSQPSMPSHRILSKAVSLDGHESVTNSTNLSSTSESLSSTISPIDISLEPSVHNYLALYGESAKERAFFLEEEIERFRHGEAQPQVTELPLGSQDNLSSPEYIGITKWAMSMAKKSNLPCIAIATSYLGASQLQSVTKNFITVFVCVEVKHTAWHLCCQSFHMCTFIFMQTPPSSRESIQPCTYTHICVGTHIKNLKHTHIETYTHTY